MRLLAFSINKTSSNQRLGVRSLAPMKILACCSTHYLYVNGWSSDISYWQSPLLFCGIFHFFDLWLASDILSTELRLQVNCDLMTSGDTLRDSLMENLALNIHAKHLSFTLIGNVLFPLWWMKIVRTLLFLNSDLLFHRFNFDLRWIHAELFVASRTI